MALESEPGMRERTREPEGSGGGALERGVRVE